MMAAPPLCQLRLRVPPPAEEPAAALLEAVFGEAPAVYADVEAGRVELSLYRPADAPPAAAELARLRDGLVELRKMGLLTRAPRVVVRPLRPEEWAESWKRHFRARRFGGRVLVRPSWSRQRPRRNEVEVVLDPGLSFGTGQHATTAFCLEQIAALAPPPNAPKKNAPALLDAGTGSGILAIAAVKLGFRPVRAFDFDPEAVRVARENAARNGVADRLRPVKRDARRLPAQPRRRYDVVAANLVTALLVELRDRLTAHVAPGGRILVAGILREQFPAVRRAYERDGWRLVADRVEREWRSGAFQRPERD